MTLKTNHRRQLTAEEIHELDERVRELTTQIADHKDTIIDSKARIKSLTEAAEELARKSKAGVTFEEVDALVYYDFEENTRYLVHPATGEVIKASRIPKHELQADFFAANKDGSHLNPDDSMLAFLRGSGIQPEDQPSNAPDERDIAARRRETDPDGEDTDPEIDPEIEPDDA